VVRLVVVGVVVVVVVLSRCLAASSLVGTRHKVTAVNRPLLNSETVKKQAGASRASRPVL